MLITRPRPASCCSRSLSGSSHSPTVKQKTKKVLASVGALEGPCEDLREIDRHMEIAAKERCGGKQ